MKTFKEHITEQDIQTALLEIAVIIEEGEGLLLLSESRMAAAMGKIGLKAHKTKGLIQYLKSAGKGIGKMVIAAIKGDTETVKKVARSIRKEDVVHFLLQLDMATLHILSSPIHTIAAITGWELEANISHITKKAAGVADVVKTAVRNLKNSLEGYFSSSKEKAYFTYLDKIAADV